MKPKERGTNMKTRLIAVLVALAAVAVFTTEASAMYHAGMGVFMQRDPGPGAGGPARMGAGGAPAATGRFIPRDPIGTATAPPMARNLSSSQFTRRDPTLQYADGPNLYQYVRSDPIGRTDPMGLESRPTKFWHFRSYGDPKIYSIAGEEQHSVISEDRSKEIGVDYGPREKKSGEKGKKIDGLAWLLWGAPGYTDPWNIQFKLDYSRATEEWKLCIKDTGTMRVDDKDVECKCATEAQVKSCITRVAEVWDDTTWKRGHDCRHFVQAAETECCLEKCSP